MIELAPIDTTLSMANKNPKKPKKMSNQKKVSDQSDLNQNALLQKNYHGWKRPDKPIQYQEEVKTPDESYIVLADTSIDGLLNAGVVPAVTRNYSGDITDMSYASTQDVRLLQRAVSGEVSSLKKNYDDMIERQKSAAEITAAENKSGGKTDTNSEA